MSAPRKSAQQKSATVLRLVPKVETPNLDTISCLEVLLSNARQGRIVGLAFVAVYPDKSFVVDTVGTCSAKRSLTRGMVRDLDDLLAHRG